jgi:hypothetical protein
MSPRTVRIAEQGRLDEAREADDAWNFFTHDHARSRAYH